MLLHRNLVTISILTEHLGTTTSSQRSPGGQRNLFVDHPHGAVHHQRLDNSVVMAAGSECGIGHARRVCSLTPRNQVDVVGGSGDDVGNLRVWRECRREAALLTQAVGPLGVSRVLLRARSNAASVARESGGK